MKTQSERRKDALKFLAVARQVEGDASLASVYLHALADIDADVLERVCYAIAKESRRAYKTAMPDVGTLREHCERLSREDAAEAQLRALPPPTRDDEDGPRYACRDCYDGDWGPALWCPGAGASRAASKPARHERLETVMCGRPKPHAAHTFVQRCHCWGRNPNVERRRREATRTSTEAA